MDNSVNETKRCPYCFEEINARAIKCKHCQSMLLPGAVPAGVMSLAGQPAKPVSGLTKAVMYVLAGLIPVVGIIAGFIYRAKPDPRTKKFGTNLLIFSIVMFVIGAVFAVQAVKTTMNYYRSMSATINSLNGFTIQ